MWPDGPSCVRIVSQGVRNCSGYVATVLNVSKSGVQLELATPLPPQATIEILASDGVAIFGEVRYCRAAGPLYHAGVYIHDTLFMPRPEHIHEDSLLLYAKGCGLSVHEFLRIEAHLEHCEQCRSAAHRKKTVG